MIAALRLVAIFAGMDERRFERLTALLRAGGPVNEAYVASEAEALAGAGLAQAALLASSIAGAGFGRAQDWDAALHWLGEAAALGRPEAQAQIQLLSGGAEGGWRALAAGIDVRARMSRRTTVVLNEAPRIGASPGFLDDRECAWIVNRARPMMRRARVYDPLTGSGADHAGRSNSEAAFTILELDLPLLLIRARIANTMDCFSHNLEIASVFHYAVGQTFAPHYDFIEPATPQLRGEIERRGQRVATFLVYLNDGFEGGETHFTSLGRRFRVGAGDGLFFHNVDASGAPDASTQHEGAPTTRGEKWLLSQFIRDKEQCPG